MCASFHDFCFSSGKAIHAVVENAYEHVSLFLFPRFGVDDVCGISGPVDFDLLVGFAVDVHCSPADAFVLQDVVAELRVHQRLGVLEPAFFKIFRPEELLVHSIAQQFTLDMVKIGQFSVGDFPGLVTVRVDAPVDFPVGEAFFQGPAEIVLVGQFQDLVYGLF